MSEPQEGTASWDALARAAAGRRFEAEERGDLRQLIVLLLDGSPYAVPVERVREIVRVRPITPIPRTPCEVRGVISLRGEIVQVIDLRRRLGLPPVEPDRDSRILVVHTAQGSVAGILVDRVSEVLRVAEEALRPGPAGDSGAVEALCECEDRFVSLLDLERVLEIDAAE